MPVSTKIIGQKTTSFKQKIDARWLMAYAAGIGDNSTCYMDTTTRPDVIAHPLFSVCLEWPVILDARNLKGSEYVTEEESARVVHASHDLHIFKSIRAGDTLTTQGTIIGIEKIKPGAAQHIRLDTINQNGELVTRTYQLSISRRVDVIGDRVFVEDAPAVPVFSTSEQHQKIDIPIDMGAANIYTETAKIFNPIHTDRAIALAAGLPDIILHGTATLAMSVSQLVQHFTGGQPEKISRIGARFNAMVMMPSILTLIIEAISNSGISFTVLTQNGEKAISNGFICLS